MYIIYTVADTQTQKYELPLRDAKLTGVFATE